MLSPWLLALVFTAAPVPKKGTRQAQVILQAKVTPNRPVAENLRAAATIYSSATLEEAKVFAVVDTLAELFEKGMLPLGERTGQALERWTVDEPLSADERQRLYSHVLGAGDATQSTNLDFDPLFSAYLASVSAHARKSDVRRLRYAGRKLALNLSNRTYGGATTVATRLAKHVDLALAILEDEALQKHYGASSSAGLVEAVAQKHLGTRLDAAAALTQARLGAQVLAGLSQVEPARDGADAEELAPPERRAPKAVRRLERLRGKAKPRPVSKHYAAVVSLCLTKDGHLIACESRDD